MGEVCMSGPRAASTVRGGPANRVAKFGSSGERRRLHDFEVLLVLSSGAGGNLVKPFASVGFADTAEAIEGVEELIVRAGAGAGDEAAHGEGVDEFVVEMLVLEDAVGTDIAFTADGLRRNTARRGFGLEETEG